MLQFVLSHPRCHLHKEGTNHRVILLNPFVECSVLNALTHCIDLMATIRCLWPTVTTPKIAGMSLNMIWFVPEFFVGMHKLWWSEGITHDFFSGMI